MKPLPRMPTPPFWIYNVYILIANGFVSSNIYDKCDDFDFDIMGFPFMDSGVPLRASCGACVSQLVLLVVWRNSTREMGV